MLTDSIELQINQINKKIKILEEQNDFGFTNSTAAHEVGDLIHGLGKRLDKPMSPYFASTTAVHDVRDLIHPPNPSKNSGLFRTNE